ncbi:tryptophan halogenase family protein [Catenovulum adriaticum]|uniref:Tryptophan 7-halogenase n=1 Tax=Catenovulum adriaticum TaxID=2984846 RepID=A0ABY7ARM8_9ALTE|nr:tryptophan halogenase family protein [Catenovulum sp. TS8]WAJ71918.1 tryptophan 7-halogenase [Catenovulum sp. TS8]
MQNQQPLKLLKKIVILGGGTAGWMTAAALSRTLKSDFYQVVLVESAQIGTVGVGEATIPHIREFNTMLGINEVEFMRATDATFKLAIRFKGWGADNADYFHPFSDYATELQNIQVQHLLLATQKQQKIELDKYSIASMAAKSFRFCLPEQQPPGLLNNYSYAYHLNATKYATFLRSYSEKNGVKHIEGNLKSVELAIDSSIKALQLEDGRQVTGDFFIDCSGFNALLLGKTLQVEYKDWSEWLKCDRAIAMPSKITENMPPYTQSTAHSCGWMWSIPLQNRTGNGIVYSSKHLTDNKAADLLCQHLQIPKVSEFKTIKFKAGMRKQCWQKNCVAIGLSSGFLEPLESTSIYLIQVAIMRLLELLPSKNDFMYAQQEFNRLLKREYIRVRDFIILHYWLNERNEPFWQSCRKMQLPTSLEEIIQTYQQTGEIFETDYGLFQRPSWLAVTFGQGLVPQQYDARARHIPLEEIETFLNRYTKAQDRSIASMSSHSDYLAKILGKH